MSICRLVAARPLSQTINVNNCNLGIEMREEHIRDWANLTNLADRHKRENWLYRGVSRRDHDLTPKIGRGGARGMDFEYNEDHERLLLEKFKRQARPLVQLQPGPELEWMAVAQHHGLNTRLLDWTESLLVAAMFATESGLRRSNVGSWGQSRRTGDMARMSLLSQRWACGHEHKCRRIATARRSGPRLTEKHVGDPTRDSSIAQRTPLILPI